MWQRESETAEQLACLSELKCNEIQGYLIARPMASEDATEWLAAAAKRPPIAGTSDTSRLPVVARSDELICID